MKKKRTVSLKMHRPLDTYFYRSFTQRKKSNFPSRLAQTQPGISVNGALYTVLREGEASRRRGYKIKTSSFWNGGNDKEYDATQAATGKINDRGVNAVEKLKSITPLSAIASDSKR